MFLCYTPLLLCGICAVIVGTTEFTQSEGKQRIEILEDYNIHVRPSNTTEVNVTLALRSLKKLDMEMQALSTTFYLHVSWFDERLTWTPNNTEYVLFNIKEIWTPNLVIDNFIEDSGLVGIYADGPVPLRVSNTGSVLWVLRVSTITICRVDITFYPYDTQTCHINITEWAYTVSEVNLVPATTEFYPDRVYIGSYAENNEWELLSSDVQEQEVVGSFGLLYTNLQYTFVFKRLPGWYTPVLMIPLGLLSIMMAGVFVIPVESGEKMTYSLTVMLSFTVILSYIYHTLPSVSDTHSLLGVYTAIVLVTGGVVVALSASVLCCHHKEKEKEAMIFDKLCLGSFGLFYFLLMIGFVIRFHTYG